MIHIHFLSILLQLFTTPIISSSSQQDQSFSENRNWSTIHHLVYEINPQVAMKPEDTLYHLHELAEFQHDPYDEGLANALISVSQFELNKCHRRTFLKLQSIVNYFSVPNFYKNIVIYLNQSQNLLYKYCEQNVNKLLTQNRESNTLTTDKQQQQSITMTSNLIEQLITINSLFGRDLSQARKSDAKPMLIKSLHKLVEIYPIEKQTFEEFDTDFRSFVNEMCQALVDQLEFPLQLYQTKPLNVKKLVTDQDNLNWLERGRLCVHIIEQEATLSKEVYKLTTV